MNLAAKISWRYLFARKSTNVINIITLLAAFGVAIGTAALILVLSVFNGFENLFLDMFNNLNPDVRITVKKGKTFTVDETLYRRLLAVEGVRVVSQTLEELAYFKYQERNGGGRLRGVDARYARINGIDTMVRQGAYDLNYGPSEASGAVIGSALAQELGVDVLNPTEPLTIFMSRPRPRGSSTLITGRSPFKTRNVVPTGIIQSQETMENQAVIIGIGLARQILSVGDSVVTSLELGLHPGFDQPYVYEEIAGVMGPDYEVRNRYQQENSILQIMQLEKWIAFLIVTLMMILISFNLVGALWMIVLEKRQDIATLRSLGMTAANIRNLFLRVGLIICGLGILAGFVLALAVGWLQINYGILNLPGYIFEAYPIALRPLDFLIVAVTVLLIGLLASLLPALRAREVSPIIIEE